MRRAVLAVVALLAGFVVTTGVAPVPAHAAAAGAGDWPAPYGDQGASGTTTDTSLTVASLAGLHRGWSAPAPGFGPFVVAGGLVVTTTLAGLEARDAATGTVVWRHEHGRSSSPLVVGTRLLATDHQGSGATPTGLVALDLATGRQLWYRQDPDSSVRDLYGTAVLGSHAYALSDQGVLRSYDLATGAVAWSKAGFAGSLHAAHGWLLTRQGTTPVALDSSGSTVWTGQASTYGTPGVVAGHLVVGDYSSGVDVWPLTPCATACPSSLHLDGSTSSIAGTGSTFVRGLGKVAGSADPATVQALDAGDGHVLWTGIADGSPVVSIGNGIVYATDSASDGLVEIRAWRLSGCGASTCAPVWTFRFPALTDSDSGSVVVPAHGRLYVRLGSGGLQALAAPGGPYPLVSSAERSGVAVVARGDRTDVFLVGADRALHHRYRVGTRWSTWESLGGSGLTGSPAAASWAQGRYDVFVRTSTGQLRHVWFAGRWSAFEQRATGLTGDPAVTAPGSRALDVVWPVGTSVSAQSFRGRWLSVASLPSEQGVNGLSVVSMKPGRIDVFGIDAYDNWVVQVTRTNGVWGRWGKTGMSYLDDPSDNRSGTGAASWAPGRLDLVFNGQYQGPLEHVWFDGTWHHRDEHAVWPVAGPSLATGATRRLTSFSVSADLGIVELAFDGSRWTTTQT